MKLQIDRRNLWLIIHTSARVWRTEAAQGKLVVSRAGAEETFPLAAAKSKAVTPYRTGIGEGHRLELAGFGNSDIRLVLLAWLDKQNAELHVSQ